MTTLRKQFKDLLLHLDQEDFDFLLEIATKYPWCDRHKNGKHCKFIDFASDISEEYGLNGLYQFQVLCFDTLGYDDGYGEREERIFQDLLYALIGWLSYSKNKKAYKVLSKISDLKKDFTNAQIIVHKFALFQVGL